jgi:hypothetical protein
MPARQRDPAEARLGVDVGGVDHREPPPAQADACQVVQRIEGIVRGGLVVFVVSNDAAHRIRREDLARPERAPRER